MLGYIVPCKRQVESYHQGIDHRYAPKTWVYREYILDPEISLALEPCCLCSSYESAIWQPPLYKDPRMVLQFTTFVEIVVPMFSKELFTLQVVATVGNAETGAFWNLQLLDVLCCTNN